LTYGRSILLNTTGGIKQSLRKRRKNLRQKVGIYIISGNEEGLFAMNDSYFSYKNMENLKEEEENNPIGAGYVCFINIV
jgi:hypothetical protein